MIVKIWYFGTEKYFSKDERTKWTRPIPATSLAALEKLRMASPSHPKTIHRVLFPVLTIVDLISKKRLKSSGSLGIHPAIAVAFVASLIMLMITIGVGFGGRMVRAMVKLKVACHSFYCFVFFHFSQSASLLKDNKKHTGPGHFHTLAKDEAINKLFTTIL